LRSALAVAAVAAALAGCGGDEATDDDDGYPQEAVDAFVAECRREPGANADTCRCVVAELQERMAFAEFERADAALKAGRDAGVVAMEKLRAAVGACS
jgi:hypothetical protein